jgi:hypothetical protein
MTEDNPSESITTYSLSYLLSFIIIVISIIAHILILQSISQMLDNILKVATSTPFYTSSSVHQP